MTNKEVLMKIKTKMSIVFIIRKNIWNTWEKRGPRKDNAHRTLTATEAGGNSK